MPKIPKDSTNTSNIDNVNQGKNLTTKEIEKLAEEYERKFLKGRQGVSYGWDKVEDPVNKKKNWVVFLYGETNDSLKGLPDKYKGVKIIKKVIGKVEKE